MSRHFSTWLCALVALAAVCLPGCGSGDTLRFFSLEIATGPAGSLMARGRCDVGDGALVLLHAVGGEQFGAFRETAILTPVADGRFAVDLGVYEKLAYRVEAVLASHLNPEGTLPVKAPRFSDRDLRVEETAEGWEIVRQTTHRIGAAIEEKQGVIRHVDRLAAAAEVLEKFAGELREIADVGQAAPLARWYRRYWDDRRQTLLGEPSIDVLFPAVHNRLIVADQTLQRRFHATLAATTGVDDEVPRLGATDAMLNERLARIASDLAAIRAKLPTKK